MPAAAVRTSRTIRAGSGARYVCVTFAKSRWRRRSRYSRCRCACRHRAWNVDRYFRPAICRRSARAAREHGGEQYRHRRSHARQTRKLRPQRGHRRSTRSKGRPAPPCLWTSRPERANQQMRWLDPFVGRSVHWKGSGSTPGLSLMRRDRPDLYATSAPPSKLRGPLTPPPRASRPLPRAFRSALPPIGAGRPTIRRRFAAAGGTAGSRSAGSAAPVGRALRPCSHRAVRRLYQRLDRHRGVLRLLPTMLGRR